jgi:hypothetical protein
MFELFSRMAKKPTLTKLDDDGETQMDMCKLRVGAARRVRVAVRGARCAVRGARCVNRCVSVICVLFVLAYVSAGAPQTSTCPATLAPATTGTPLRARPAAAAPTKLGEGSWYGEGRFSCLHLGVVLAGVVASRRRGPLPRPNSRTHRHTHATQKRGFPDV